MMNLTWNKPTSGPSSGSMTSRSGRDRMIPASVGDSCSALSTCCTRGGLVLGSQVTSTSAGNAPASVSWYCAVSRCSCATWSGVNRFSITRYPSRSNRVICSRVSCISGDSRRFGAHSRAGGFPARDTFLTQESALRSLDAAVPPLSDPGRRPRSAASGRTVAHTAIDPRARAPASARQRGR